jgi:hypothetical protein
MTAYNLALVAHVVGITIMAGTTFIDFVTFRAFCSAFKADITKGLILEEYLDKLQKVIGIGMLIILVSGFAMMIKLHEVWGAQLWFRIKMGILLLIIINGLGLRRRVGAKLKKFLTGNLPENTATGKYTDIKKNFTIVQTIQMLLFTIIFVLSVFKFN